MLVAAFRTAAESFEREVARVNALQTLPDIVADLRLHAFARMKRCPRYCAREPGKGPKTMVKLGTDVQVCPECEGVGQTLQESGYKEWAQEKLLKIGELPEDRKAPLVAVQNNNTTLSVGGGFMEKMVALSDEVMRRRLPAAEVVEALPVQPRDHQPE